MADCSAAFVFVFVFGPQADYTFYLPAASAMIIAGETRAEQHTVRFPAQHTWEKKKAFSPQNRERSLPKSERVRKRKH